VQPNPISAACQSLSALAELVVLVQQDVSSICSQRLRHSQVPRNLGLCHFSSFQQSYPFNSINIYRYAGQKGGAVSIFDQPDFYPDNILILSYLSKLLVICC